MNLQDGINVVILSGKISNKFEVKNVNNSKVFNFSIAVPYTTRDGKEYSHFFNCEYWGNDADNVANALKKNARVLIQGSLNKHSYTSNEERKHSIKIRVRNIQLIDIDVPEMENLPEIGIDKGNVEELF